MSIWQKIGIAISLLWLIGLPIYLALHARSLKTVGDILIAGNVDTITLWIMMLAPILLLWSLGALMFDGVRWIKQRVQKWRSHEGHKDGDING